MDIEEDIVVSEVNMTLPTVVGSSMVVTLSRPKPNDDRCMISLDSMEEDCLPKYPGLTLLRGYPELKKMTLPCGHYSGAMQLFYQFMTKDMLCPYCRRGFNMRCSRFAIPTHFPKAFFDEVYKYHTGSSVARSVVAQMANGGVQARLDSTEVAIVLATLVDDVETPLVSVRLGNPEEVSIMSPVDVMREEREDIEWTVPENLVATASTAVGMTSQFFIKIIMKLNVNEVIELDRTGIISTDDVLSHGQCMTLHDRAAYSTLGQVFTFEEEVFKIQMQGSALLIGSPVFEGSRLNSFRGLSWSLSMESLVARADIARERAAARVVDPREVAVFAGN